MGTRIKHNALRNESLNSKYRPEGKEVGLSALGRDMGRPLRALGPRLLGPPKGQGASESCTGRVAPSLRLEAATGLTASFCGPGGPCPGLRSGVLTCLRIKTLPRGPGGRQQL